MKDCNVNSVILYRDQQGKNIEIMPEVIALGTAKCWPAHVTGRPSTKP